MSSYAGPDQSTLNAIDTNVGGHPMIQIAGQNSVLPLKNDWTIDVGMKIWESDRLEYRTIFSSENSDVILAIKRVGVYDGDTSKDTLGFQVVASPISSSSTDCHSGFHEFQPPIFASAMLEDKWLRLSITFVTSTQTYSAYIDGAKVGTVANVCTSKEMSFGVSAVGGGFSETLGGFSSSLGALEHFAIYTNKALSDEQILLLEKGDGMCSDLTTPPSLELASNRDTKMWPFPGPEPGCTYSGDPCVCLLRCPLGQKRYGDGSACRDTGWSQPMENQACRYCTTIVTENSLEEAKIMCDRFDSCEGISVKHEVSAFFVLFGATTSN